jgi:nucleotide-binding universal stress UspA family protein
MFKNILVPTDGSATALRAAQQVADLIAPNEEAQITVILAIAPLSCNHTDYDEETISRYNKRMQEHAEAALESTCRVFCEKGLSCHTKIVEGDPVSAAIAEEVGKGNYDVVVMGSRGLGMQKDDLHYLGSVTEHTIRRVSIPVLVVPTHKSE